MFLHSVTNSHFDRLSFTNPNVHIDFTCYLLSNPLCLLRINELPSSVKVQHCSHLLSGSICKEINQSIKQKEVIGK